MGNRATATWVALVLGSVAFPSDALAQSVSRGDEMIDASGWSLEAAMRPSGTASEADPLAPLALREAGTELAEATASNEMAGAATPSMPEHGKNDDNESASQTVTLVTNWIVASGDNGGLPFMVIDKLAAKVFLFDSEGQFVGVTPALLGVTAGDDSAPGVGDRELSEIKPEDRTTPAGRFVAQFGRASGNRNVLWVDYATSISLHAVVTRNKKERRLQRLKSPSAKDNRITYGCINVPTKFYRDVVRPLFTDTTGIVYILPETKYLFEVFPGFRPDVRPAAYAEGRR